MAKQTHFEDNIFFANLIIRLVKDACRLELNASIYSNWIFESIVTCNSALENISSNLLENQTILEFKEQLSNLVETWNRFVKLLSNFENLDSPVAQALNPGLPRLAVLRTNAKNRLMELAILEGKDKTDSEDPSVVSLHELNQLLSNDLL